jgi:molybdenum cofactor cytidylyltransferase
MARSPSFAGLILAAGESARMGRDKALLPWHDTTFLGGAIDLLNPYTEMVIVVAGKNAAALEPLVYSKGASLVVNPEWQRGQFSSLQVGLRDVLNHGRDAAIVALVDHPPARLETVDRLRAAFAEAVVRDKWAVVPEHGGKHGHPVVLGREIIEAFLKAAATAVAREIEHAHQHRIEYVPVDDPLVVASVDTPEDYQRLVAGAAPSLGKS